MELNGQPSHSKLMQTVKFPDGALHVISFSSCVNCEYVNIIRACGSFGTEDVQETSLDQPWPGTTAGNDNVPGALSGGKARFLEVIQKLDAEFSNELICCNIFEYIGDWKWLWNVF